MARTDPRLRLVGKRVESAAFEDDELYLNFGGGWGLLVINPFASPLPVSTLVGATLLTFEERGSNELLGFDTGATVAVDMRETAYRGPEAMQLHGPDDFSIIWN